jgi:hypothetical protein
VDDRLRVDELLAAKLNLLAVREAFSAEFAAVRREEREACAKAICPDCAAGTNYENGIHAIGKVLRARCPAAAIRAMNEKDDQR